MGDLAETDKPAYHATASGDDGGHVGRQRIITITALTLALGLVGAACSDDDGADVRSAGDCASGSAGASGSGTAAGSASSSGSASDAASASCPSGSGSASGGGVGSEVEGSSTSTRS